MSIQYTFLSEKQSLKGTKLQVCNDETTNISVLQYKAEGCLLYSHERGMYSENQNKQITRINEFLCLADRRSFDLVIAPEAAVPLTIIKEIIDGKNKRPESGKLWCLGAEGIAKQEYKQLVDEWSKREDIVFLCPHNIDWRQYVNAAFYFFQTASGKMTVILQAKTGGMRDISFEHEQADLSVGDEIFVVDLNGDCEANNVLATLICADILNVNSVDFCGIFHGKYPIILNIQMNSKPFHGKIIEFRERFFSDKLIRNGQIIVANWGRNTMIWEEGTVKPKKGHSDSGSAIYLALENNHGNDRADIVLEKKNFIEEGIGKGQNSGLEYFLTINYEIWKIQEKIEVVYFELKRGYRKQIGRDILVRQYFPYIVNKYQYDNKDILQETKELMCDCDEMQEILKIMKKRASMEVLQCANKDCENCKECKRFYADALVSLCLDESIFEEYEIKDGKSSRAVQALYQDCRDTDKKNMLKQLVDGVEEKKFPQRFGEFNDNPNMKFEINYDAAKTGGNYKYNLVLKDSDDNSYPKRILVVFLGSMDIAEVRQRYIEIKKEVHEDKQNDILLFYLDAKGKHIYSEPYEKESITAHNNDFSQNIESFIQ